MPSLLDPTLDVVFKMLLLHDQILLRDMIEAVLVCFAPIRELVVLNPTIPDEYPGDKIIVLDIRARLKDGRQIDLEMQSTLPAGTRARCFGSSGVCLEVSNFTQYFTCPRTRRGRD